MKNKNINSDSRKPINFLGLDVYFKLSITDSIVNNCFPYGLKQLISGLFYSIQKKIHLNYTRNILTTLTKELMHWFSQTSLLISLFQNKRTQSQRLSNPQKIMLLMTSRANVTVNEKKKQTPPKNPKAKTKPVPIHKKLLSQTSILPMKEMIVRIKLDNLR